MNDQLLSLELAEILKADSEFAALFTPAGTATPLIHGTLTGEDTARPSLSIMGEFTPYGPRRKGMVSFEIRSRIGEQTDELQHHARFDALYAKLLGTGAIAAIQSALAGRGNVTVTTYGPYRENTVEADVEGEDLRTTLRLGIVWAFL